jgi:hypothetical protein
MRVVDLAPIRAKLIRSIAGLHVYGSVHFPKITGTYVVHKGTPLFWHHAVRMLYFGIFTADSITGTYGPTMEPLRLFNHHAVMMPRFCIFTGQYCSVGSLGCMWTHNGTLLYQFCRSAARMRWCVSTGPFLSATIIDCCIKSRGHMHSVQPRAWGYKDLDICSRILVGIDSKPLLFLHTNTPIISNNREYVLITGMNETQIS